MEGTLEGAALTGRLCGLSVTAEIAVPFTVSSVGEVCFYIVEGLFEALEEVFFLCISESHK